MGGGNSGGNSNGSEQAFYEEQGRQREQEARFNQMLADQKAANDKAILDAANRGTAARQNATDLAAQADRAQAATQNAGAPTVSSTFGSQFGRVAPVQTSVPIPGIPNFDALRRLSPVIRPNQGGGVAQGATQTNTISSQGSNVRFGGGN